MMEIDLGDNLLCVLRDITLATRHQEGDNDKVGRLEVFLVMIANCLECCERITLATLWTTEQFFVGVNLTCQPSLLRSFCPFWVWGRSFFFVGSK
jgi:hypothetical protein